MKSLELNELTDMVKADPVNANCISPLEISRANKPTVNFILSPKNHGTKCHYTGRFDKPETFWKTFQIMASFTRPRVITRCEICGDRTRLALLLLYSRQFLVGSSGAKRSSSCLCGVLGGDAKNV